MEINKWDVFQINLDPTVGSEIKKVRPGLVISPNEINHNLNTLIILPLTTAKKSYPTRIDLTFDKKKAQIVLEQIKTIDRKRIIKKMGSIEDSNLRATVTETLIELFS